MSDVPDEFIPDEPAVVEDAPICPGCDEELPPPVREYKGIGYRGALWHIGCAAADDDGFETATPRYCPNCWGFSKWRPVDAEDETQRLCDGCGVSFSGTETKGEMIKRDYGIDHIDRGGSS